jgi:hypothetical protein
MSINKIRQLTIFKKTNLNTQRIPRFIHTMTKGKATATVSGRTIAETDEYEVVEGNVYVSMMNHTLEIQLC